MDLETPALRTDSGIGVGLGLYRTMTAQGSSSPGHYSMM